ncbi:MAG TPA: ATP-binding cassette domain-containing protein [Phototrophicaceae bacterium]|jgi:ABC-2 type transport system ATP-binding protein|nr:ATP-binding cassette domain-containing protein [Phototrophicaceae bacterium]
MMIDVKRLHKSFKNNVVLDGIDLKVAEGSIFSLLGPNGAGKTTTVQILSTLIRADSGEVWIANHDLNREPEAVRAVIGMTGQFSAVDNVLTGEENMLLMANLRHLDRREGRRRSEELLERFDLTEVAKKSASTYSGGMRRKLDLAMGLVGNPRVVFLDEPTTGLDPRSRQIMWQLIQDLAASGVTIFLTTQYLEEADHLANRIAVLDKGKLVAEGTPAELKRRVSGGHIQLEFADAAELEKASRLLDGTTSDTSTLTLRVPTNGNVAALRNLLDRLDSASITVSGLSVHTPDLDDVFFALTSQPAQPVRKETV